MEKFYLLIKISSSPALFYYKKLIKKLYGDKKAMTNNHIHRNHATIASTWKEEKIRRLSDPNKNKL